MTTTPRDPRICVGCSTQFMPNTVRHIYCTRQCSNAHYAAIHREIKRKWRANWVAAHPLEVRMSNRESKRKRSVREAEYKRQYLATHPIDPLKRAARILLNNKVATGEIVRPTACIRCFAVGRVQGHHPDYSKPLEVLWLCKECHIEEHWPLQTAISD